MPLLITNLYSTDLVLDTENPSDWIAIVENSQEIEVTFTAIDKCIEIRKVDGSGMDKRCDGMLTYANWALRYSLC